MILLSLHTNPRALLREVSSSSGDEFCLQDPSSCLSHIGGTVSGTIKDKGVVTFCSAQKIITLLLEMLTKFE